MPSVETSIWLALKARAQGLVLSPVLPIAWPNESFAKPTGGYLRVTHIPNVNRRLFLGSTDPHQRLGLLQIDVFGRKNENVAVAGEIAGNVAAHFACGTEMWSEGRRVSVTKAPDVGQPIDGDTHIQVPVTIAYECFA
ncbi:hypothetical protein GGQ99_001290 [Aminobacter niigataensis]|uniref:Uncharacterized protein n=1 Tax=Aminobacter niigataensis TaxID=83265 RepID=A0ABR6KYF2_9HYPH|nr:DUF4128 domain-containing protein [Aminobacter niigataensis]MBB4649568.1 hypothetical protein [Aminobacter niigataensis]